MDESKQAELEQDSCDCAPKNKTHAKTNFVPNLPEMLQFQISVA